MESHSIIGMVKTQVWGWLVYMARIENDRIDKRVLAGGRKKKREISN